MIVSNYYNFFKAAFLNKEVSVLNENGDVRTLYPAKSFTAYSDILCFYYINTVAKSPTTGNEYGVALGDDDTPSNVDDFGLKGNFITTVNATSVVSRELTDNGKVSISSIFTIANTSSEKITIKELVYFGPYSYSTSGSALLRMCYDRTVLDTPLEIEGGGVGQLTYDIVVELPI